MVIQQECACVQEIMIEAWANPDATVVRRAKLQAHWAAPRPVLHRGMPDTQIQDRRAEFARLIVAVGRRDRDAFAIIFEYFAPRVKTMMTRSGVADQRAEDLAQDTMLAVWHKAHLFDPAGAGPSAWIYTIARNLRIDALRREQRARRAEGEAIQEPEVEQCLPDAQLSSSEAEEKVRTGLANLSEDQMKVVTLSFFENRPHPEIAQALGIPLGTVKSRLRLAMKRLRALLEEPQ
jgi:RNA polymerase sigma-70 factor, ECF subfamily